MSVHTVGHTSLFSTPLCKPPLRGSDLFQTASHSTVGQPHSPRCGAVKVTCSPDRHHTHASDAPPCAHTCARKPCGVLNGGYAVQPVHAPRPTNDDNGNNTSAGGFGRQVMTLAAPPLCFVLSCHRRGRVTSLARWMRRHERGVMRSTLQHPYAPGAGKLWHRVSTTTRTRPSTR